MTQQQIFDKVATHLLTQGAKSMMGDTCRYRGSNGAKCAVGCLIKDDHYDPILELRSSRSELVKEALIKSKVDIHTELLVKLQYIHDHMQCVAWDSELQNLAKTYNLSASVVTNFNKEAIA